MGPRGTGKSLWTQYVYRQAIRVDLLQPDIYRTYSAHPERLRALIDGHPDTKVCVVDEVQKVPDLLSVVHGLIESKRPHVQFVLTGSSARKLKRAGVDLMAGRAVLKRLHPYMAAELGDAFSLRRALDIGLVPLVVGAPNPHEILASYCALYLREEVQMEGLVRNIGGFSRFLEAVSFSHASVLNTSSVARECQVERKTVEGYLDILEDLLLAFRIPVFAKRAKRSLAVHAKLFLFDTGVFRSLRPHGLLDHPEEIDGQALEGLVAQHLRAWIDYTKGSHQLYYWRTRSGVEVDFIVYGEDGIWAIEVKNSARVKPEDLRGLKAFQQDYPEAQCALLYRGDETLKVDGIQCVPCEDALRMLHPQRKLF
jgi:predicted AAA+ superfamily ATPase